MIWVRWLTNDSIWKVLTFYGFIQATSASRKKGVILFWIQLTQILAFMKLVGARDVVWHAWSKTRCNCGIWCLFKLVRSQYIWNKLLTYNLFLKIGICTINHLNYCNYNGVLTLKVRAAAKTPLYLFGTVPLELAYYPVWLMSKVYGIYLTIISYFCYNFFPS